MLCLCGLKKHQNLNLQIVLAFAIQPQHKEIPWMHPIHAETALHVAWGDGCRCPSHKAWGLPGW